MRRRDRLWRGAGEAVPVFSLLSRDSVGVGEFLDLIKLIDLADKWVVVGVGALPIVEWQLTDSTRSLAEWRPHFAKKEKMKLYFNSGSRAV